MQKAFSILLTFVAASFVVAVISYKFLIEKKHVQNSSDVNTSTVTITDSKADAPLEFNLLDEEGKAFTGEDLKGKVSIVNFVFKSCKTICPFIMSKTRALAPDLADYNNQIRFISVSVDPANDTQEVLQAWKKDVAVPGIEWKFLTGTKNELFTTIKEDFKQTVMDNAANMDMPIAHSSYLVLVDADGKISGFYDSNENFKMKELTEKASSLAGALKRGNRATL